jgi:hypothetical protein
LSTGTSSAKGGASKSLPTKAKDSISAR